jgi:hypothetical protein
VRALDTDAEMSTDKRHGQALGLPVGQVGQGPDPGAADRTGDFKGGDPDEVVRVQSASFGPPREIRFVGMEVQGLASESAFEVAGARGAHRWTKAEARLPLRRAARAPMASRSLRETRTAVDAGPCGVHRPRGHTQKHVFKNAHECVKHVPRALTHLMHSIAYLIHTFLEFCTLFLLIILFHADFLQTFSRLRADKFFALQTFCINRAHIERAELACFNSLAAQQAGARWHCHQGQKGRGGGATAAAAGAYFALGEALASAGAALEGEAAAEPAAAVEGVAAAATGAAAFEGTQAVAGARPRRR